MISVLFVCLGNICRSPLAEGIFRHKVEALGFSDRFLADSAGCGGWHTGEQPDRRSIAVAASHGIDITGQSARQVTRDDFIRFDLILGLDRDNVAYLDKLKPWESSARVALYLDEALGRSKNVPDPYYGGRTDFENVFRLCDEASDALVKKLAGG